MIGNPRTRRAVILIVCVGAAACSDHLDEPESSIVFTQESSTLPTSRALAVGDINDDGLADVLAVGWGGPKSSFVIFGDGHGFATSSATALEASDMGNDWALLEDLDNDGDLDAVIDDPHLPVWLNDGAGMLGFTNQTMVGTGERSRSAALGDLDGDGDVDLFQGNFLDSRVWLNDGYGRFTDTDQALGEDRTVDVALGDLDGDGDLDAYVANVIERGAGAGGSPADRVWLNDGAGGFSDSGQRLGVDDILSTSVALGDLDGDGDLDAMVGSFSETLVWLNDGGGVLSDSGQRLQGRDSRSMRLGDLDGDGDLDAFSANFDEGHQIWENDGSGQLSEVVQLPGRYAIYGVLADVDGDADLDILVSYASEQTEIWVNQFR